MQDFKASEPLKAASYFHLQFEAFHPFADGNGRVVRTLMNYFLMTHNHPPIIIYDEDKKYYYAALQSFDEHVETNLLPSEKITPFSERFIIDCTKEIPVF